MLIQSERHGTIPIESVNIGEKIAAKTGWTTVRHKEIAVSDNFVRIRLSAGEEVDVTPTHPFSLVDGTPKAAADLCLNHVVLVRPGIARVVEITRIAECDWRVRLSCEPDHEFYVGRGAASILVHNYMMSDK
jgi:intein/homing endonuclease